HHFNGSSLSPIPSRTKYLITSSNSSEADIRRFTVLNCLKNSSLSSSSSSATWLVDSIDKSVGGFKIVLFVIYNCSSNSFAFSNSPCAHWNVLKRGSRMDAIKTCSEGIQSSS